MAGNKALSLFKITRYVLPFFMLTVPVILRAQSDSACQVMDDKKAVELYEKGADLRKYKKDERMEFLQKAMQLEPDYVDANFLYAEELIKTAVFRQESFAPAVPYFMKVIQQCPHYHSDPYYFIGFSYYEDQKYKDAITYLQKFLDFKDDDVKKFSRKYDDYLYEAKQMLKYAHFYVDIFLHPVPFDPYPVKGLCTTHDEYLACISPDNQYAFFTRKLPLPKDMNEIATPDQTMKEFFMKSERGPDGNFTEGAAMPSPFNGGMNEGGPTITIDDKHLYFTICNQGEDGINCDLYNCNFEDGQWTAIQNMGAQVNDPDAWDSQPSISADGLTLYFASDRKGGYGKIDIWETHKDPTSGDWGTPVNLGPTINTAGNDKSPFIHSDSHTLYFSSDGRFGIGGYDIFYSRADSTGKWGEPKNIGYPINSPGDDLGFFVSTDGNTGYFCSNDPNRTDGRSMGGWDIFQFALYKAARPQKVAVIEYKTTAEDGTALQGAEVTITDSKTGKKAAVMNDTVNATAVGVINLENKDNYVATVTKKGYVFNSGIITAKDTFAGKPITANFQMKEVAAGENYKLNNIYYQSNSALLEPVSVAVINQFALFLKENPTIKIKIVGYTDNVGNETDNLALSKDRAFTVMQALQQAGVKPGRLSFQGMGSANPVASNDTEEGRQKNRRTEFIIEHK